MGQHRLQGSNKPHRPSVALRGTPSGLPKLTVAGSTPVRHSVRGHAIRCKSLYGQLAASTGAEGNRFRYAGQYPSRTEIPTARYNRPQAANSSAIPAEAWPAPAAKYSQACKQPGEFCVAIRHRGLGSVNGRGRSRWVSALAAVIDRQILVASFAKDVAQALADRVGLGFQPG